MPILLTNKWNCSTPSKTNRTIRWSTSMCRLRTSPRPQSMSSSVSECSWLSSWLSAVAWWNNNGQPTKNYTHSMTKCTTGGRTPCSHMKAQETTSRRQKLDRLPMATTATTPPTSPTKSNRCSPRYSGTWGHLVWPQSSMTLTSSTILVTQWKRFQPSQWVPTPKTNCIPKIQEASCTTTDRLARW